MKRILLALPLLALGTSALANTAAIHFTGEVVTGSCPITIVDPGGNNSGTVDMGEAMAGNFDRAGIEVNHRDFAIQVDDAKACPGWNGNNDVATVRFFGLSGGAENDELFALDGTGTPATGVALGIKDDTGAPVGHGGASKDYPLAGNGPDTLAFTAFYKSMDSTVTAGDANANVAVELTIN